MREKDDPFSPSPVWKCLGSKGLKHEHAEALVLCREDRIYFSNYEARACGMNHSGPTVDHMFYCCYSTIRHEKVLKALLKMLIGWWVITEKNEKGILIGNCTNRGIMFALSHPT